MLHHLKFWHISVGSIIALLRSPRMKMLILLSTTFKNSQKYGKFEVHILSTIWKIPKYNFYKLLWGS